VRKSRIEQDGANRTVVCEELMKQCRPLKANFMLQEDNTLIVEYKVVCFISCKAKDRDFQTLRIATIETGVNFNTVHRSFLWLWLTCLTV